MIWKNVHIFILPSIITISIKRLYFIMNTCWVIKHFFISLRIFLKVSSLIVHGDYLVHNPYYIYKVTPSNAKYTREETYYYSL